MRKFNLIVPLLLTLGCASSGDDPDGATDPAGGTGGAGSEAGGSVAASGGAAGGTASGGASSGAGGGPTSGGASTGGATASGGETSTGGLSGKDPALPVSSGTARIEELDNAAQFFNDQVREFGHTSNSSAHQQNALVLTDGKLLATYFDADGALVIARKNIEEEGAWVKRRFPASHNQTDPDSHRTANIAVSPADKRIHLMWGHHADKLRYAVTRDRDATLTSDEDFGPGLFEAERQYLRPGQDLTKVCYPRMFVDDSGKLHVVWRDDGGSGNAHSYLSTYEDDKTWTVRRMIVNGKQGTYRGDGNRNAYFNDVGSRNGVMHLSWTYRENAKAQDGLITNHDLHYAFSPDSGATWFNRNDEVVGNTGGLTMNLNSKDVKFRTLGYDRRIDNQTGQAIDRTGRVHMLFRHEDDEGNKMPFHYFKSDGSLQINTRARAALTSSVRPKLYADPSDNAENTLYVVTIARGKLKVYGANQGEEFWSEWETLYTSDADYLNASGLMSGDGRTLYIAAQRRPANTMSGTSSPLDVITLPVEP